MIHRSYRQEDRESVVELLQASFDGWHGELSAAHWQWKFEDNPHGHAHIWVADDGGTITGCYVFNPVRLRFGPTELAGAQSVDAAVHPDHQGRGIFTDLARLATNDAPGLGIDLVYAFPTVGAYRGQLRVGFESSHSIGKMYRPLLRRKRFDSERERFSISTVERFDERFDRFADPSETDVISIRRDAAYLNWRYIDHPTRSYDVLACELDGQVYGYIVLYLLESHRRLRPAYIVDLTMAEPSAEAADALLRAALHHLGERGAHVVASWTRPSGIEQSALESAGFSDRYAKFKRLAAEPGGRIDEVITFDARSAPSSESESPAGPSRWSLVRGDADFG